MQRTLDFFTRRFLSVLVLLAVLVRPGEAVAARLVSSDGKTRDFPVVVSAGRAGLTVRETVAGRDILIPWERLDVRKTAEGNAWFGPARNKAVAGQTVPLNLGLDGPGSANPAPSAGPASPDAAEWRTVKTTVAGGDGANGVTLKLSAYVHREVETPRLAVVWVGSPSPLAKRGDAADLARRMQGALVVAEFEGAYAKADDGSGQALVTGVTELLKQARTGARSPASEAGDPGRMKKSGPRRSEENKDEEGEEEAVEPSPAGPALILMGRGEAASFVWSLVCTRPRDVLAAVTLDGIHRAESTAGAFATPCLFLQTPGPPPAASAAEDLTRAHDLWRHFSTDGCRWCYAAPEGDPLALAVAFAWDVAAASPYVEALELLESWENNALRHRIPMPVKTAKDFEETGFRLATPDGGSVHAVAGKTGAGRNDLVWIPSPAFAARLAGK